MDFPWRCHDSNWSEFTGIHRAPSLATEPLWQWPALAFFAGAEVWAAWDRNLQGFRKMGHASNLSHLGPCFWGYDSQVTQVDLVTKAVPWAAKSEATASWLKSNLGVDMILKQSAVSLISCWMLWVSPLFFGVLSNGVNSSEECPVPKPLRKCHTCPVSRMHKMHWLPMMQFLFL